MTATKQFIEDAIEGGWKPSGSNSVDWDYPTVMANYYHTPSFLLDHRAWQAVGKTRGWVIAEYPSVYKDKWNERWHAFIDHLADGKTIEEALQAISN